MIQNPILPGFQPDPSICRVGGDYYIATSTFEWWPAVRIHHSRDLVDWQHAAYAVTRTSQLDLRGHADSSGVWAPCLSHAHGRFWLIYSAACTAPTRTCATCSSPRPTSKGRGASRCT
jgi:xylan 1,4-beta-xylosidase